MKEQEGGGKRKENTAQAGPSRTLCAPRALPLGDGFVSNPSPALPQANLQGVWDVTDLNQRQAPTVSSETRASPNSRICSSLSGHHQGPRHGAVTAIQTTALDHHTHRDPQPQLSNIDRRPPSKTC